MAKKQTSWKTRGMNRDLSVSAFSPEFSFENMNLRLSTNEGNTLMSWVNERGTAQIKLVAGNWVDGDDTTRTGVTEIYGTPIGTAVINHKLVIFTTDTSGDYIYVLRYADDTKTSMLCKMLYGYQLGFDVNHPLETLVSYESEDVQKVYWTDGNKQPRVINIEGNIINNNSTQFDFVPELQLKEIVTVKKQFGASGMFAPGVIQYAFTYYRKNGQESCIFYTTPLYYISHKERGGSPEDKVDNAFRITIENVDGNFDYLRIYSIQRTSINATPICKRVQDIQIKELENNVASYLDTGINGDSIDPTELLYKGGETISAETMEQKDNTLFLGNLKITRPNISSIKEEVQSDNNTHPVQNDTRTFNALANDTGDYKYANQLSATDPLAGNRSVSCAGFKYGDYYRCGVQFQYKTGKWSDPVFLQDMKIGNKPFTVQNVTDYIGITVPTLKKVIGSTVVDKLLKAGYKKARAVVVFPNPQDRVSICQGVTCPTLYTSEKRGEDKSLYSQASWFFRTSNASTTQNKGAIKPKNNGYLEYTSRIAGNGIPTTGRAYNPQNIRQVEVQGDFEDKHKFQIDYNFLTFHSPDIDFDESMYSTDFTGMTYRRMGDAIVSKTLSDIDIQTETPTISNSGGGFIHKSFSMEGDLGIVSGLFYDDYSIDDYNDSDEDENSIAFEKYRHQHSSFKYMVYAWNKNGSLNNDINRPSNKGTITAILKKKVISNLRFTTYSPFSTTSEHEFEYTPQLFSSNENTIVKVNNCIYQGNIDTMLVPDHADGQYYCFNSRNCRDGNIVTPFDSNSVWWKTFSKNEEEADTHGFWWYNSSKSRWEEPDDDNDDVGGDYVDLVMKKEPVRMKYKSSPHLVFKLPAGQNLTSSTANSLPVIDIIRSVDEDVIFGGKSQDAFKANIWLPCGEPAPLIKSNDCLVKYSYGDTYFQRYDCLKTYAYTREDVNQIVEIGSFMLETRTNIDGRYDRNRGQINNLNMSPVNFNLINKVYSQQDNFFQYRIQDDDYYNDTVFPNQITWSKTKTSGADVDMWTNVTLASILELDGNKGQITSLQRLNDLLICFQDTGISQILYNENVQVSSTAGVPIEIANSGKVQGKRYYTDTIGCSNKWSIVSTLAGIYFMDSNDKSIYNFSSQIQNVSQQANFSSWSKQNIPSQEMKWDPVNLNNFVSFYDKMNQEVLFVNKTTALAFSEKMGTFTSFYSYENTPFFCNLDDTGIWIKGNQLWKHQAGSYGKFFGVNQPYWMTLVGNPEPQADKQFTNLEFRACVTGEGRLYTKSKADVFDHSFDYTFHPDGSSYDKFLPFLPFDYLEVWNEHQHGYAKLENKMGRSIFQHHTPDNTSALNRKFRLWACDIPRNNCVLDINREPSESYPYSTDEALGISRFYRKPQDRMRNPWIYLKLMKNAAASDESVNKAEIHDIVMTFFS